MKLSRDPGLHRLFIVSCLGKGPLNTTRILSSKGRQSAGTIALHILFLNLKLLSALNIFPLSFFLNFYSIFV